MKVLKSVRRSFLLVVICFFAFAFNSNKSGKDLVSYWAFDEGAGSNAADSSRNGHDGTINGATWVINGECGYALEFGGGIDYGSGDYVAITSINALGKSNFTIDFWIKTTRNNLGTIYHQGKGDNQNIIIYCNPEGKIYLADGGGNTRAGVTDSVVNDGIWHHIAIIREGIGIDQTKIYVDGEVDKRGTFIEDIIATDAYMGGYDTYQHWFEGGIDEFHIYNRALLYDEIQADMNECDPRGVEDSDGDGIPDSEDNCPNVANGPDAGTCVATKHSKKDGKPCKKNQSCGCMGFCSMDQEDTDEDGMGDVCDN